MLFRLIPWQKEFEDMFPYERDSDDQLKSIMEVKRDMRAQNLWTD